MKRDVTMPQGKYRVGRDMPEGIYLIAALNDYIHRKCDGDCANSPPHYGYRYGRWYYGHSHSEGCVFGGNKCNGGRD